MVDTHELRGSTVVVDRATPKDPKRSGHRGFGFVTFSDDGVADRVAQRSHEICGQQVAIDSATPVDDDAAPVPVPGPVHSGNFMMNNPDPFGYGAPMRSYGRMYGSLDFDIWGYGVGGSMSGGGRPSRAGYRYRPY